MRTASASMRRVAVSGCRVWLNSARYGSENCRWWVMSTASSGSPVGERRPVMTPTGSTLGTSSRLSWRSSSYSRYATVSPISLMAMTPPEILTNRTMWREMPRGRAASVDSGHSSSGISHGRSSSAGSGAAAVICRFCGMGCSLRVKERGADRRQAGPPLVGASDQAAMRSPEPAWNRCSSFGRIRTQIVSPLLGTWRGSTRTTTWPSPAPEWIASVAWPSSLLSWP